MEKKWFSARELMGKAGLPSTPQGVNLMARREGWVSRRRSGVQGKALEYHIDSLPFGARSLSALRETDHPDYDVKRQDPIRVWIEYYYHLTPAEREKLLAFLMREGMSRLLQLIAPLASSAFNSPLPAPSRRCATDAAWRKNATGANVQRSVLSGAASCRENAV